MMQWCAATILLLGRLVSIRAASEQVTHRFDLPRPASNVQQRVAVHHIARVGAVLFAVSIHHKSVSMSPVLAAVCNEGIPGGGGIGAAGRSFGVVAPL